MTGITTKTSAQQIDDLYPVAGQDNNSQGFRDNFSYTKTGLIDAGESIAALETNAAKLNANNDFNGVLIENAVTKRVYGTAKPSQQIPANNATSATINVAEGEYQQYSVNDDIIPLTIQQWPAGNQYAKIVLDFTNTSATETRSITLAASSGTIVKVIGTDNFFNKTNPSQAAFILPASTDSSVIIEAWKYDNTPTIVYLKYVGTFV